jgi:hypothetical protein
MAVLWFARHEPTTPATTGPTSALPTSPSPCGGCGPRRSRRWPRRAAAPTRSGRCGCSPSLAALTAAASVWHDLEDVTRVFGRVAVGAHPVCCCVSVLSTRTTLVGPPAPMLAPSEVRSGEPSSRTPFRPWRRPHWLGPGPIATPGRPSLSLLALAGATGPQSAPERWWSPDGCSVSLPATAARDPGRGVPDRNDARACRARRSTCGPISSRGQPIRGNDCSSRSCPYATICARSSSAHPHRHAGSRSRGVGSPRRRAAVAGGRCGRGVLPSHCRHGGQARLSEGVPAGIASVGRVRRRRSRRDSWRFARWQSPSRWCCRWWRWQCGSPGRLGDEDRRTLAIPWDIGSFFSRRFHPFAPPTYRDVVQRDLRRCSPAPVPGPVVVSAHSQGSIVAAAALDSMPDRPWLPHPRLSSGHALHAVLPGLVPATGGDARRPPVDQPVAADGSDGGRSEGPTTGGSTTRTSGSTAATGWQTRPSMRRRSTDLTRQESRG